MKNEVKIILAEDDEGHAKLIEKNLKRAGVMNEILRFSNGQETLDYFYGKHPEHTRISGISHLLLMDIRMPRVDGVEVLGILKKDPNLAKMPVIMLTTTDDPQEIEKCHNMGCNNYITKPINYEKFISTIRKLGLFLMVVEVPAINGTAE
ncbi:MAG: response regulator [Spirochaetales bacterium]|nr:response regulator [Spirochaetales bacterium]